jgi:GNAT superfamily N-acetyltransferase
MGLISSIATSVANGSRSYESYFWWSAVSENQVQGVAIRTVPFGYVFSPMPLTVAHALFSTISTSDDEAKEFAGPKAVIDYIEEIAGETIIEDESELIYECKSLIPSPAKGRVRTGTGEDFELIMRWMQEFMAETGLRSFNLESVVRNAIDSGRYSLLEINGIAVSLGGNSDLQKFEETSIVRVGPIYTPKPHRKNGYGSALTSEITAKIKGMGAVAMLYTQAGNPTSNKIYQEIGYTLVDENRRIVFV